MGSGDASPAPLQGAENGNPNPACTDAPLPAIPGQSPDEVDKLFWFNAGFFHETRQRSRAARRLPFAPVPLAWMVAQQDAGPLSVELFLPRFQQGDPYEIAREIRMKAEGVMRRARVI